MTQVPSAPTANHFVTAHSITFVIIHGNGRIVRWFIEAWPPGARVKLCVGFKKFLLAAGAVVCAFFVVIPVLTGKSPFGPFFSQYMILSGC
jgi:hypothetical protein